MNWLWFIPMLLVMVVIHELGHFLTARYFGMKVHEFGIGFPPKVWSRKTKDGMEWSINALPIGGFVRIEGENGDSTDPNSFGAKPTWQRAIVLSAGPIMNIILALVLFWLITFIGGKDVANGRPAVVDVSPNSPAAAAGIQPGDIFVSANGNPINTINDFRIETTLDRNNPVQLVMDRNGQQYTTSVLPRKNPPEGEGAVGVSLGNSVGTNELMLANTAVLNKELGLTGANALKDGDKVVSVDGQTFPTNIALINYITNTNKESVNVTIQRNGQTITQQIPIMVRVDVVYKNSSAATQNVPVGAIVTKLDNTPIHTRAEYQQYLQSHQGQQITLTYKNTVDGKETPIVLLSNTGLDANAENRAPRVTQQYSFYLMQPTHHVGYNPVDAAGDAWSQTVDAITLIPRTLKALIDGSVPVSSLAGPVGMAQITDTVVTQSAQDGIWSMFRSLASLTALLSVNLGVMNILPLPALDGGRLIFVLIEMVSRGKRVPPEKEGMVHFAGMIALLTLMVAIAWQDIVRLVSGGSF
ncbi:MAG TPA: RIP metalloprotease RseP [Chloroflexia bacterium]|nr:RIP metalloprotease RseP [Chloroflexia bacterium]